MNEESNGEMVRMKIDGLVKSPFYPIFVIPAKAEILMGHMILHLSRHASEGLSVCETMDRLDSFLVKLNMADYY